LAAKRELEAEAARSCHVGFGDPDCACGEWHERSR
jgi:hypothetical protein